MEPQERSADDVVGLQGILKARQPELAELKVRIRQLEQRKSNERYLRSHPELNMLLSLFMSKVLDDHPDDVVSYAGRFFDRPDLKSVVEELKSQEEDLPASHE